VLRFQFYSTLVILSSFTRLSLAQTDPCPRLAPFTHPPPEFSNDFRNYKSPLVFDDGRPVKTAADWQARRKEILNFWNSALGSWPPLVDRPRLDHIESKLRGDFMQHRVRVQIAADKDVEGFLLVPTNSGPFPAVLIPFYEPQTSIGLGKPLLDFGYALTKRGFVTLSIGSPGGDARRPPSAQQLQPLSWLAYVAANCANALSNLKEVDPDRIGIVGHSYGGKWALFASCLYEKFACAVWCDPGIAFDETRPNVNYWEPWYIGLDPEQTREPGVITDTNPRTGPYKRLYETGHDLHELHALMAPRPFLVSGGSEDPPERWRALNHTIAVNRLLGHTNRVAVTNRPTHTPTPDSNEQIYAFFECWLKRPKS
jgi:dienelactone hydrolase